MFKPPRRWRSSPSRCAELFRAYTVRSERASLFSIGIFSNKYMQYAVGASMVMLLIVCAVPFLQPIFNTHFLSGREWGVVVGLALIPPSRRKSPNSSCEEARSKSLNS